MGNYQQLMHFSSRMLKEWDKFQFRPHFEVQGQPGDTGEIIAIFVFYVLHILVEKTTHYFHSRCLNLANHHWLQFSGFFEISNSCIHETEWLHIEKLLFHIWLKKSYSKYSRHTFTFSPSISTVFIMKSTPMVAPCPGGNNPCNTHKNQTL